MAITSLAASEALTNATKHAGATTVAIEAIAGGGELTVRIADDGHGGADVTKGSGVRGLVDRVEALGGELRIESPPGGGTRIVARLPLG